MSIVTRFAPSPTGALHLGGARTALFNWLYARHYGGQFHLRLEDTDSARSQDHFARDIYETLTWLGLTWDGPAVLQSQRRGRHQEVAYQLLEAGQAYACYCTPEELEEMREKARLKGEPPLYDRRWREPGLTPPASIKPAIRLKVPLEGSTVLVDQVQGRVEVKHDTLDDMVLLRSDGTPTYMLAVVVDDHDMGVTHIIRGDDHLTNAFRQMQIYRALGWAVPTMAHIPLIHSAEGRKLSKREGAPSASDCRLRGLLPEAVNNTLMRLGWAHGDEEKISIQQAIEWFDGTGLSKAPARFDEAKLLALNAYYLRGKPLQEAWQALAQWAEETGRALPEEGEAYRSAQAIFPAVVQRSRTLEEAYDMLLPYTRPLISPVEMGEENKALLKELASQWVPPQAWTASCLEESLRGWAALHNFSFGQVARTLRLALVGSPVSPSLTEIMVALGPEWTGLRIKSPLEEVKL